MNKRFLKGVRLCVNLQDFSGNIFAVPIWPACHCCNDLRLMVPSRENLPPQYNTVTESSTAKFIYIYKTVGIYVNNASVYVCMYMYVYAPDSCMLLFCWSHKHLPLFYFASSL